MGENPGERGVGDDSHEPYPSKSGPGWATWLENRPPPKISFSLRPREWNS